MKPGPAALMGMGTLVQLPPFTPSASCRLPAGLLAPTLALPMGTVKSLSSAASSMGKASPYRISFSSTTTCAAAGREGQHNSK